MAAFSSILTRLDNLSYCLFWTEQQVGGADDTCSVDVISSRGWACHSASGTCVMIKLGKTSPGFNTEHEGLFVSNTRDERVHSLLVGLPRSLVLENANGDLFVLLPAGSVPAAAHCRAILSTELLFDCRNDKWLRNLGIVRHYLYTVHVSRCYLSAPRLPHHYTCSLVLSSPRVCNGVPYGARYRQRFKPVQRRETIIFVAELYARRQTARCHCLSPKVQPCFQRVFGGHENALGRETRRLWHAWGLYLQLVDSLAEEQELLSEVWASMPQGMAKPPLMINRENLLQP